MFVYLQVSCHDVRPYKRTFSEVFIADSGQPCAQYLIFRTLMWFLILICYLKYLNEMSVDQSQYCKETALNIPHLYISLVKSKCFTLTAGACKSYEKVLQLFNVFYYTPTHRAYHLYDVYWYFFCIYRVGLKFFDSIKTCTLFTVLIFIRYNSSFPCLISGIQAVRPFVYTSIPIQVLFCQT